MTLPTPPLTGPDEIDTSLSYTVDTGRTATWQYEGHVKLVGSVWYQSHSVTSTTGDQAGSCVLGPFAAITAGAPGSPLLTPGSNPQVIMSLLPPVAGSSQGMTLTFQIGMMSPTYRTADYHFTTLHGYTFEDSDVAPGVGSGTPYPVPLNLGYGYTAGSYNYRSYGYCEYDVVGAFASPTYFAGATQLASNDPIPTGVPLVSAPVVGPLVTLSATNALGVPIYSATGTVGNSATELTRITGNPASGSSSTGGVNTGSFRTHSGYFTDTSGGTSTSLTDTWTNDLSVVSVDEDFTVNVSVKEQFVSTGRNSGVYRWVVTAVNVSCAGGSSLTASLPSVAQQTLDSIVTCNIQSNWGSNSNTSAGGFERWSYAPTFEATLSNWHLAGTPAGNDFTALGGPVPLSSTYNNTVGGTPAAHQTGFDGHLDARSASLVIDTTNPPSPVSTTPTDPGYNKYIYTSGGAMPDYTYSFGGTMIIVLAPTVASPWLITELWWDGSAYTRKPADSATTAIAAAIAAWNTIRTTWGTAFHGISFGLGPSGYSNIPTYPYHNTDVTAFFVPSSLLGSPYTNTHDNFAKFYVRNTGDPWYTANIGRKLGTLNLSVGALPDLSAVSLHVASDAMGGSNTDTYAASLGNWAAMRYLLVSVTGTLTAGTAKLTITTADGHSADYTLKIVSGTAEIDLACPDSQSAFSFGSGVGLSLPVPAFVSTGATGPPWYKRTATDTPTAAANAAVASITLTLSGALQTLTVDTFRARSSVTGYDAWTDPKGDGQGYAREVSQALINHVPSHVPWLGHLDALADGKLMLRYPAYGSLPNISGYHDYNSGWQDYYDIPTMLDDLIYDLGILASGLSATWSQTFTPPGASIALSSRNIPAGMVVGPDVWAGQDNAYNTWPAAATTLDIRRELTSLGFPLFSTAYHLEGMWLHGGGLEGLVMDYVTNQRLAGATLKVAHDPDVLFQNPITGYPAMVTHASNAPTGSLSVPCDANGFFRSVPAGSYEVFERPSVQRLVNAPMPVPALNSLPITDVHGTIIKGAISEMTYNHLILIISTMIPRLTNLGPRDGSFHVAGPIIVGGTPSGIAYWRCDTGCPRPGVTWDTAAVVITSNVKDGNPSLAQDYRGRLYCQFDRAGVGVYETVSDDDGQTWSAPIMGSITNGQYPVIRAGHDGSIYRAAYVDDGTGMGTGVIKGQWQAAGDVSPSAAFTFKDNTGTAIPSQAGAFAIDHLAETAGRWILTVLRPGEVTPVEYVSADDAGGTWVLVT